MEESGNQGEDHQRHDAPAAADGRGNFVHAAGVGIGEDSAPMQMAGQAVNDHRGEQEGQNACRQQPDRIDLREGL